ncbi:hypothetical protein ADUPG1_002586, partial [Aduncisulcus paluster]
AARARTASKRPPRQTKTSSTVPRRITMISQIHMEDLPENLWQMIQPSVEHKNIPAINALLRKYHALEAKKHSRASDAWKITKFLDDPKNF